jgi:hypothetical protein
VNSLLRSRAASVPPPQRRSNKKPPVPKHRGQAPP